ncbi:hypothetical protein FE697_005515 [Mumia zhuanghuii]|uniref:DUF6924 domain-containing protein n=1 Tax=Mumia zhuanghuii TaxID=2585211 RepID=A0A5Q6S4J1_9ACTN|nr:hypothetical protein FE697_005515 [Mumia zhuanghuii]
MIAEVTQPTDFGGSSDGTYTPNVTAFDHPEFEGATGDTLVRASAALYRRLSGFIVVADARSMHEAASGAELTVAYVDLSVEGDVDPKMSESFGRTFRCAVREFGSVESNLAIANMDFRDFADNVQSDGVFRGFGASG